jgi:hypothetical protein
MEIVPTSKSAHTKMSLESLNSYKESLKDQIYNQREQISKSSNRFFSLDTVTSYVFGVVKNNFSLTDGFAMGFRVFKILRKLFSRKK